MTWIIALAPVSVACGQNASQRITDVGIVQERFARSVLPSEPGDIAHVHEIAAGYAASLEGNDTWKDIDYADKGRAIWKAFAHLDRTLVMAKSVRLSRDAGRPDVGLESRTVSAIRYWTDHDYRNPNWWWNEIGVPETIGEIACLMGPTLPVDQKEKVIGIMQRSNWQRWTGANLVWGVANQIVRGCLQGDAATVAQGYARMYQEIKIVGPTQEGIQADFSFHQHGAQLYNGGYGLDFGNDVGRFISYASGTTFQVPPDKMKIFAAYLLDGQQWMVRGNIFDYSACGREIVRKAPVTRPDWAKGGIDPTGPAYALQHMVLLLADERTPWQSELSAFAERLSGKGSPWVGNKQFWCSDYMADRRSGFFTSVKMLSDRMLNGETVNKEGKKSEHLSDGANYLYLDGDEYNNIFPAWDWTKVPGTTAIQGTLNIGGRNPVGQRGQTAFAGGVSDGTDGACAMDLHRGKLKGRKAWFFFDNCYVCLGSGIDSSDTAHSVATDVNQTLLSGEVKISLTPSRGTPGEGGGGGMHENSTPPTLTLPRSTRGGDNEEALSSCEDRTDIHWIYHNHVGYFFAPGERVCLSAGNQSGRWSDIGAGSHDLVTVPVFDLWIDHGKACRDGNYQYTVVPNISEGEMAEPVLDVLENGQTQAVVDPSRKLLEAVFRGPASLKTPIGQLQVDHACLLMGLKSADGIHITAENPENQSLTLNVRIDKKAICIQLPGGNLAGSSVSALVAP